MGDGQRGLTTKTLFLALRFVSSSNNSNSFKISPVYHQLYSSSNPSHSGPADEIDDPYSLTSTSQTLKLAFQPPAAIAPCVPLNPEGENARHPVPSSNPSRVCNVDLEMRSNILIVESCPPLSVS